MDHNDNNHTNQTVMSVFRNQDILFKVTGASNYSPWKQTSWNHIILK